MTEYPLVEIKNIVYKEFDTCEDAQQFSSECYLGQGTTQFAYEVRQLVNDKWAVLISDDRVYDGSLSVPSLDFK